MGTAYWWFKVDANGVKEQALTELSLDIMEFTIAQYIINPDNRDTLSSVPDLVSNIEKKTKNGKPYWIIKTIDSTSIQSSIKCWGVKPERDVVHLNRPYMSRLDYDEQWGFSTRSIKYNFRLLG